MSKELTIEEFNSYNVKDSELYTFVYLIPEEMWLSKIQSDEVNNAKRKKLQAVTTALITKIINSDSLQFVSAKADPTFVYYNVTVKIKPDFVQKQMAQGKGLGILPIILVIAGSLIAGVIATLLATYNFKPVKVLIDTAQKTLNMIPWVLGGIGVYLAITLSKEIRYMARG
jgi:hypothetical protein